MGKKIVLNTMFIVMLYFFFAQISFGELKLWSSYYLRMYSYGLIITYTIKTIVAWMIINICWLNISKMSKNNLDVLVSCFICEFFTDLVIFSTLFHLTIIGLYIVVLKYYKDEFYSKLKS